MLTTRTRTLAAAAVLTLTLVATACGDSDSDGTDGDSNGDVAAEEPASEPSTSASSGADELGGAGPWTSEQLCALSTPDAVQTAFGVDEVEEIAGTLESSPSCRWIDASDPAAPAALGISLYPEFTSERLGADEDVEIPGADIAGFSENIGGAANLMTVVGTQALEITFPVGTEGASEFGSAIASVWVAQQTG